MVPFAGGDNVSCIQKVKLVSGKNERTGSFSYPLTSAPFVLHALTSVLCILEK